MSVCFGEISLNRAIGRALDLNKPKCKHKVKPKPTEQLNDESNKMKKTETELNQIQDQHITRQINLL